MKVKSTTLLAALLVPAGCMLSCAAFAAFEEANVPVSVKALYCDSNPRILVEFADASKNIWFPANAGDQSKAFLAAALTAKAAAQKLYYLGSDPAALTSYCVSASARQIIAFGLTN